VNQQVHLDLLPIDSRRPARGGFFVSRTEKRKQKRVSLHRPQRRGRANAKGPGSRERQLPGLLVACIRNGMDGRWGVCRSMR
jgi:hypothetical protein